MMIYKGQLVVVKHKRKGTFMAKVTEDFDTESVEWYPLTEVADSSPKYTSLLNAEHMVGDTIPCRAGLVYHIEVLP